MSAPSPSVLPPLPYSWRRLALALAGFALLALICALLALFFFRSRPLSLLGHTDTLADMMEEALTRNRVPPDYVKRSEPEARSDSGAVWRYYEFEVTVPHLLSAPGVETLLREKLEARNAALDEVVLETEQRTLVATLAGRPFATVRLVPAAAPQSVTPEAMVPSGAAGAVSEAFEPPVTPQVSQIAPTCSRRCGCPPGTK